MTTQRKMWEELKQTFQTLDPDIYTPVTKTKTHALTQAGAHTRAHAHTHTHTHNLLAFTYTIGNARVGFSVDIINLIVKFYSLIVIRIQKRKKKKKKKTLFIY